MLLKEKYTKVTGDHFIDSTIFTTTIVFVAAIVFLLTLSIIFKKQLRRIINLKVVLPLAGVAILIIPMTDDYITLFVHGKISSLLVSYFSKDTVVIKIGIYFTGVALLLKNRQLIRTMTPLMILVIAISLFMKRDHVVYDTLEYTIVISSLLSISVITRDRYAFVNFFDSLFIASVMIGTVLITQVAVASNINEAVNLRVRGFHLFRSDENIFVQVASWAAVVVASLFTYLFIWTSAVYKTNAKQTFALIRLEDKYRKANIEFNFEQEEISFLALLISNEASEEATELPLNISLPQEPQEEKVIQLRKIYLKSKGIRSPAYN